MDLKRQIETGIKLRGIDKVSRIPIKILPTEELPKKPEWIRAKITDFALYTIKIDNSLK